MRQKFSCIETYYYTHNIYYNMDTVLWNVNLVKYSHVL